MKFADLAETRIAQMPLAYTPPLPATDVSHLVKTVISQTQWVAPENQTQNIGSRIEWIHYATVLTITLLNIENIDSSKGREFSVLDESNKFGWITEYLCSMYPFWNHIRVKWAKLRERTHDFSDILQIVRMPTIMTASLMYESCRNCRLSSLVQ